MVPSPRPDHGRGGAVAVAIAYAMGPSRTLPGRVDGALLSPGDFAARPDRGRGPRLSLRPGSLSPASRSIHSLFQLIQGISQDSPARVVTSITKREYDNRTLVDSIQYGST